MQLLLSGVNTPARSSCTKPQSPVPTHSPSHPLKKLKYEYQQKKHAKCSSGTFTGKWVGWSIIINTICNTLLTHAYTDALIGLRLNIYLASQPSRSIPGTGIKLPSVTHSNTMFRLSILVSEQLIQGQLEISTWWNQVKTTLFTVFDYYICNPSPQPSGKGNDDEYEPSYFHPQASQLRVYPD